jgi:hypothetical protein
MCICHDWHNVNDIRAVTLCQWWQIHILLCVSNDIYTHYYFDGIVSVMTDTHITIMMALCQWWQIHITILIALPLCQWWQICILLFWCHWHCVSDDRYAYYYSDVIAVVSVMTDILIALALYQWWQIHTLLFWWHWHFVNDDRYTYYYSDCIGILSLITYTYITIHDNAIKIVICVSVITDTMPS